MARVSAAEWHHGDRMRGSSKYEGRKGLIARAARTCLERKGVAKTSIADITREVSITRELFYYYFANKASVVAAVMDSYVGDAHTLLQRSLEDVSDSPLPLLTRTVMALRLWLSTDSTMPIPMLEVLRESGQSYNVMNRVVREALMVLQDTNLRLSGGVSDSPLTDGRAMGLMGAMLLLLDGASATDEDVAQALMPLFMRS